MEEEEGVGGGGVSMMEVRGDERMEKGLCDRDGGRDGVIDKRERRDEGGSQLWC